jgi:enterochelin esterase-like enzyme
MQHSIKWLFLLLIGTAAACTLLPDVGVPEPPPDNSDSAEIARTTIEIPPTWTTQPTTVFSPTVTIPITPSPVPTETPEACDTPGEIVTGTYPSQIAGPTTRNYRVYLPPCYGRSNRAYPTLYMLHGNTHTDSIWDELGLDETAEALIQARQIPPLVIAMPDGGLIADISSGGPNSFEGVMLDEFIPFIEQNYCAWPEPDGRAIGGLSRGGYWALEIAFRFSEQFVSVGGHSASLYDTAAGPELNPQFTGLTNDLGDLRIYFDIGENDYLIPNIQLLHEEMEEIGRSHVWVLNEGAHEEAYWALHAGEYLLWYSEPWPFFPSAYPTCQ